MLETGMTFDWFRINLKTCGILGSIVNVHPFSVCFSYAKKSKEISANYVFCSCTPLQFSIYKKV